MKQVELTKAEEQVMHILWRIERGFVKDVIKELDEPKPAYSTVSTIIRILVEKKIVSYKAYGKTHEYFPLISKEDYSKQKMGEMIHKLFDGSTQKMLSFLVKKEKLSLSDLDEIMQTLKK
ncbi:BlaI/MecI/CopY family transcriptional regulator [Brumimicrobium aurantiacum]|uniref:BlaI/MecI/CopY family transcriptional regulator n=1 Tax=Brumimicrobium aurantiacum TaxID=1737063 RepID=A0A3E1EY54_9FLAO|nr:BlaI/MecI/CopY family transcriptional regulator [Brumimicrobium aurantiacum]RFC54495.1 BlaI/MecI/CopY family transcriptional regulator [Brumimicrobium aurantiacum]